MVTMSILDPTLWNERVNCPFCGCLFTFFGFTLDDTPPSFDNPIVYVGEKLADPMKQPGYQRKKIHFHLRTTHGKQRATWPTEKQQQFDAISPNFAAKAKASPTHWRKANMLKKLRKNAVRKSD